LRIKTDFVNNGYVVQNLDTIGAGDITDAITVEAWIKLDKLPSIVNDDDGYAYIFQRNDDNLLTALSITQDGKVEFILRKGGLLTTCLTDMGVVSTNRWTHIVGSWDGVTMRIFVDTKLKGSIALAAPINGFTAGTKLHYIGLGTFSNSSENFSHFSGLIDEVRVWQEGRTQDQIIASMFSPRNVTASDDADDTLKFYYKLQEGLIDSSSSNNITVNSVDLGGTALIQSTSDYFEWVVDNGFPLKYGASKIVRRFTITGDRRISLLKFTKPEEVNHCLCVGWTDNSGNWQRRKLYSATPDEDYPEIETIWPIPADYNGEPLGETFYLEVWNVDGRPTADLEEDLEILVSLTNAPSSIRSTERSVLYDTYPITGLQLTPDTQKMFGQ
jgi:hypothetical protein